VSGRWPWRSGGSAVHKIVIVLLLGLLWSGWAGASEFCQNACVRAGDPALCRAKCERDCWRAAEIRWYRCLESFGPKYCTFDLCQETKACDRTTDARFVPFQEACHR
jgi:hypothetical protein